MDETGGMIHPEAKFPSSYEFVKSDKYVLSRYRIGIG